MNDSIRPATMDDIQAIIALRLKLQSHCEQKNADLWKISGLLIDQFPIQYTANLEDPLALLLVVENIETRDIIGMGLGRIQHHNIYTPSQSGRVDDIWVDPDYQTSLFA